MGEKLLQSEVCRPGSTQEHSLLLQSGTRGVLHTLYPHGQDSWCIELGGKQMNETEAVLVTGNQQDVHGCVGWKTGAVGEFRPEALPSQGAQRRLPGGSDL